LSIFIDIVLEIQVTRLLTWVNKCDTFKLYQFFHKMINKLQRQMQENFVFEAR